MIKLTPEQYQAAVFIGVYRLKMSKQNRTPVRRYEGKYYDLLGRQINLRDYVEVA